jgi:HEAT repeat protein
MPLTPATTAPRTLSGLALMLSTGLATCLTGCATQSGSQPNQGQRAGQPGNAGIISTPVDVSKLREEAIAIVEQMAANPDGAVRANAVEAAAFVPRRLRAIIDAGLSDSTPGVRAVAASAVARSQSKDLLPRVEPLLEDPNHSVQVAAMHAYLKNGRAIDQSPLGRMLMNDDSPWVSRQAAFVLGESGNRSALGLLRSAAAQRGPVLPPSHQLVFQLQIAEAMVKLGERDQLPVIRAALYPSQPEELEAAALAAQILGELRDRESIGQLLNVLAYRDREGNPYPAEVRLGVASSLARMGTDTAVIAADDYLADANPVIRAQAASVYGSHPGPKYWDRLRTLMQDKDPSVRVAAAAAVLRSGSR